MLKTHTAIPVDGKPKFIGIVTFKLPFNDSVIQLDAPIIESSDLSLILGIHDQDSLKSIGVDQIDDCISFLDGPPVKVFRERGLVWIA